MKKNFIQSMNKVISSSHQRMKCSREVVSKHHLASDGCVADLFKMLTYSLCMLRFFIGLRLALERDLAF